MLRLTVQVGLIAGLLVGCIPPTAVPTPDIEATVTTLVATQVAELTKDFPEAPTPDTTSGRVWALFDGTIAIPTTYQELLEVATQAIEEMLTEGITLTRITLTETSADFTASAETVDQAIVFVETLRAAGRFGTVPFPRPVTEVSASLNLGTVPPALRLAIAAVPTATSTPTPMPPTATPTWVSTFWSVTRSTPTPTPSEAFWYYYDNLYLRLPNDDARMDYRCSALWFDTLGREMGLWPWPCENELARIHRELVPR